MTISGTTTRRPIRHTTSVIRVVVICLTAGVFLTACEGMLDGYPPSVSYQHATGAEDIVVSIDTAGGTSNWR